MRNILFRGKRIDNGEWVEGNLLKLMDGYCVLPNICQLEKFGDIGQFVIHPETLGQFTGLSDENGKKIFEGDIVAFEDAECDCEGYHDNVFINRGEVEYDDGAMMYYFTNRCTVDMDDLVGPDIEVIGNIHDNPNLLGGD